MNDADSGGTLPPRLLIAGCGDVARRALPALRGRYRVRALLRPAADAAGLGDIEIHRGDLDDSASLAGAVRDVGLLLHCAPPRDAGRRDDRTRALLHAFSAAGIVPQRMVYLSTSGVYGDCAGAWVDESRPPAPVTDRGARRLDAEQALEAFAGARGAALVILRVPGIYAADRLPLARLRAGLPALLPGEDGYTNHVHADDLAAIAVRALEPDAPAGVYNASDDSEMKMGDWFDLVAERHGLPRPPRVSRAELAARVSPMMLSFMSESRRLVNTRMKRELGVRLRHPTVFEGVPAIMEPRPGRVA